MTATRIKCAHCKDYHGSVAEVKDCAASHNAAKVFTPEPELVVNERVGRIDIVVPPGHYALEINDEVKFFKVDRPTTGRWAGRTFVMLQVSDDYYPVKNYSSRDDILARIGRDPQSAMLLYGQKIGRCGHCGRTLTNKKSRQLGIGPICRTKMGW